MYVYIWILWYVCARTHTHTHTHTQWTQVMIDCSHANSSKKHENQPIVAKDIAGQLQNGDKAIFGVMLESNINEGRQDLVSLIPELNSQ